MGRKKKQHNPLSYESISAYFIYNYLPLTEILEEEYYELQQRQSQETHYIKKELVLNLSKEAKYVLRLLFLSSEEVISSLTAVNYGRPTKNSLQKYLYAQGWQYKMMEETFKELQECIRQLVFLT